jgi:hypothetical protein
VRVPDNLCPTENAATSDAARKNEILTKLKEKGVDVEYGVVRDWKPGEIVDKDLRERAE